MHPSGSLSEKKLNKQADTAHIDEKVIEAILDHQPPFHFKIVANIFHRHVPSICIKTAPGNMLNTAVCSADSLSTVGKFGHGTLMRKTEPACSN